MKSTRMAALATAVAVAANAIILVAAAPVTARPMSSAQASSWVAGTQGAARATPAPPCADDAYNLYGGRWSDPVRWWFNAATTPSGYNRGAVEAVLVKSFDNVTGARNDCGRADRVSAQNAYLGRTGRSPGISRFGRCKHGDGRNVIAFGLLPRGILAVTCTRREGGFLVEADMRINSRYPWALSQAGCSGQELLEPTVTHEVGHVYGLGHVGERRHPLLTMSTLSDGPCSNAASTLGLGDMLGLEALY